jgi:hypothetical protein
MMFMVVIIGWCVAGISSWLWLAWDPQAMTWGQLAGCILLGGLSGPLVWIIIGFKVFVGADFWNKPICPTKRK